MVEVDEAAAGVSRDDLVRVLHAENVLARKYFWPGVHRMEPYRSLFPHSHLLLQNTERVAATIIVLPTGTAVGPDDVGKICSIVGQALLHGREVRLASQASTMATR